ncbi:MAG: 40S ribosomal protein S3a/S1 [Nanoarchaeota archaeon]|nr:40S ribosomal protein S3a/S1 [Nanoarchaeota archaeon]
MAEKKKVFDIEIPSIRQTTSAFSTGSDLLVGKVIKLDMAKVLRGKNIDAAFVISKKNDKLEANFISISLIPAYVKRMMRKGISWLEDSFVCKARDANLQIKPFMITKKKIHRSVKNALRNKAKEHIIKMVSERGAQDVFSAIIHNELQRSLTADLKKIYPLALCEIRVCKVVK